MGMGKSDLSLCRIRKIRGCSGGYGNCSHDNQGIAQMIGRQAVMILKIFYCARSPVGPSAVFSNGNIADECISGEARFKRLRNSRNLQKNWAKVV